MGKQKDRTGETYNRLTFVRRVDKGRWELKCVCGNLIKALPYDVAVRGKTKSCGCLNRERAKDTVRKKRKYTPIMSTARAIWRCRYRTLSFDVFYALSQQPCHYCGKEPYTSYNIGNCKGRSGYGPSEIRKQEGSFTYNGIDRIDSTRGYDLDNIVPCCLICNRAKADMDYYEFREHIRLMYEHL